MVTILMISAKMVTLGLLDVIISIHEVTNKILSHESNFIVDVVI